MPELPEVETIRQDLNQLIVGKKICNIESDSPKQIQPSLEAVRKAVVGVKIKSVGRRAKLIQIFLDNGKILVAHLKLTGRLLVRKEDAPKDQWQHVVFRLGERGKGEGESLELRFCDLRKFGWIRLIGNEKELEKLLAEFGPEPLDDLTLEKFKEILSRKGIPIKLVLMDQKEIAGVGNIYANEALFLAGIDPKRPARSLSLREQSKLYEALEQVLKEGIKYRGASDNSYLDAQGRKGHYQEHFRVYAQAGQPCPGSCGEKIKRITLGGRGTFFCPACQK